MIIFQKKIDTYLYNFNLFNIYACIYIKWYMYVYVLLVVILFIKYIFVYPNIITFFLFWIIQPWTTDRCIWNTLHYYFEISNLHFTAPSPTRKRNKTFIKSTIPYLHGNQTRKLKTEIMTYKQLEKKNQFIHKRDHKEPSDICLNFQPLLFTLSLCLLHTHKHWLRWLATK